MQPTKVYVNTRDPNAEPDLISTRDCVLKDGQGSRARVRRTAKLTSVRDRHTGAHHHNGLTIKTYALTKEQCAIDGKRSVSLDGDEVAKLTAFLTASQEGIIDEGGGYFVMPTRGAPVDAARKLQELGTPEKLNALSMLVREASEKPAVLRELLGCLVENAAFLEMAETAMRRARYEQVLWRLDQLVDDEQTSEGDLQRLLQAHPWLFGSEYATLLDRRRWTRDEVADFVPRRTSDGRLELIEIKTPLSGRALFTFDRSHKNWYPGAELSKVVAQVANYLEKLDCRRDSILADDQEDVTKITARIIIGRDGDGDQQAALRTFNGHQHRIEVMTFDGLLAIGRRVLSYLSDASGVQADAAAAELAHPLRAIS